MQFLYLIVFIAASCHSAFPQSSQSLIPKLIQEWKNAIQVLNERNMEIHIKDDFNTLEENNITETAREMECIINLILTRYQNISGLVVPLNDLTFDVLNSFIKLKGSLDKTNVFHLGEFTINNFSIKAYNTSIIKCSFGTHLNKIQLEGIYDLDLNILTLIPIYGQGEFGLLLDNFTIAFEIDMNLDLTKNQQIVKLDVTSLNYEIGQILMDLKGFIEEGDYSTFLNSVLSDVTATLLMQNKDLILSLLKPLGTYLLTSDFKEYNTQNIIEFLKHILTITGITDTCTNNGN